MYGTTGKLGEEERANLLWKAASERRREEARLCTPGKWSFARRKPKAEDFIDVSMAKVRAVVSL